MEIQYSNKEKKLSQQDCNVIKQIEVARKRLLDLTLRNSLLNFKHSERTNNQIRIVDSCINDVFANLLNEKSLNIVALPPFPNEPKDEQTTKFQNAFNLSMISDEEYLKKRAELDKLDEIPEDKEEKIIRELKDKIREKLGLPPIKELSLSKQEWAKENNINPIYDIDVSTIENMRDPAKKRMILQTILFPKELKSKINGLRRLIRSDKEEKGTNTFYIAFGFLEWTDQNYSENKHYAPLLLLKLNGLQENKKGDVFIESSGDPIQINISLREKMKELSINIPDFNDDDTPESYLNKIRKAIKEHPKWKVRNYITIGRFIFSRLAMYEDLELGNWSRVLESIQNNSLLSSLFHSRTDNLSSEELYDIDRDDDVKRFAPVLITSADSSQHSAIVDAIKGENLVIKGPPGTGKSQTITNLIANALYANKKVLFMSEKKAALDVVYSRLQASDLGDFCLELHSDKTKITNIRAELERACDRSSLNNRNKYNDEQEKETYRNKAKTFINKKEFIRNYYDLLQEKVGKTNLSLFEAIWAAKSLEKYLKSFSASFQNISINNVSNKTQEKLDEEFKDLEYIETLYNKFVESTKDLKNWNAIDLSNTPSKEVESLISQIEIVIEKLSSALKSGDNLRKKHKVFFEDSFYSVKKAFENINNIHDIIQNSDIEYEVLEKLNSQTTVSKISNFISLIEQYNIAYKESSNVFQTPEKEIETIKDTTENTATLRNSIDNTYNINKIEQLAEDLSNELNYIEENDSKIASLSQIIYKKESVSINGLIALVETMTLLSKIDNTFLSYLKNQKIFLSENTEIIKNIDEDIANILRQQENLCHIFDLDLAIGSESKIREALQSFSTAGLFAIFNSDYRNAQKFFKYIAKSTKIDNKIDSLKALLKYLTEKNDFEKNVLYSDILGCYNQGIKTNIKSISVVNQFYNDLKTLSMNFSDDIFAPIKSFFIIPNTEDLSTLINISQQITIKYNNFYFKNNQSNNFSYEIYKLHVKEKLDNIRTFTTIVGSKLKSKNLTLNEIFDGLAHLKSLSSLQHKIVKENKDVKDIIGSFAKNEKTDILKLSEITKLSEFLISSEVLANLHKTIFTNTKEKIKELYNVIKEYSTTMDNIFTNVSYIIDKFGINTQLYFSNNEFDRTEIKVIIKKLENLLSQKDAIYNTCAYKDVIKSSKNKDFEQLLQIMIEEKIPLNNLANIYGYLFYKTIANFYIGSKWESFRPEEIDILAKDLRGLDSDVLNLNKEFLAKKLCANVIPVGYNSSRVSEKTELQLIKHQVSGHARSIPLRSFLQRAGKAVQALKPCFLMSPISVAQYISPKSICFDILIIDEASQMYFEEALGGILRCKQLIVVGDEKQLPPTPFFQKSTTQEDDFDEDDEGVLSILETCLTRGFSARELLWHYRSKDDALIAFSNKAFYHNKLKLFPSSLVSSDIQGIQRIFVNGVYKNRQNEEEADAIIKAIKDFVRKYPNKSLGVATMNTTQKMLIEQKIDQLITSDTYFEKYMEEWDKKLESFFVKNLENVQGDERDFIFISTVYGPEQTGGKVLQRFGPINGKYGHRRLNVLFTRAKYGLKLFTSMKSDDIVITDQSSEGVKTLKNYLLYAETKRLEIGETNNKGVDSYFEQMVKDLLENNGYIVDTQVGVKGFFIDLAVKHPKNKSYYALGIECDGAPYHSSKSARDRDCIRQAVLEDLGWKIHRIWSKDWFFNTDKEIERLLNCLKEISKTSPEQEYISEHILIDTSEQYATENYQEKDLLDLIGTNKSDDVDTNIDKKNKRLTDIVKVNDTVHYKRIDNEQEKKIQIVHSQSNFEEGLINANTPLAIALLGSEVGEEVDVNDYSIIILKIEKHKDNV